MIQNQITFTSLIFMPIVSGFLGCVFPKIFYKIGFFTILLISLGALIGINQDYSYAFQLIGSDGILLSIDANSLPLIFGSGVVLLMTFLLRKKFFSHYFFQICFVLFSALSISFLSKDLISLYIALELTGFSAFLLVADKNDPKSLFNSFQYLVGGGLAMLIYLIGVIQAFTYTGSFLLDDLINAPSTSLCLIAAGLLTKAGIFLCGFWVPNVYSNANIQSSAVLSGCVTCAAIAPLSRLSTILEPINSSLIIIGVLSAIFGALIALLETDDGRTLGWSSVSQLGIAILSPTYGCLYAMQHGICKSILFLTLNKNSLKTNLYKNSIPKNENDTENIQELISILSYIVAGLSIAGFPFLTGFISKGLIKSDLPKEVLLIFNSSALLTSIVYVKLIFSRIKDLDYIRLTKKSFNFKSKNLPKYLSTQTIVLTFSCIFMIFSSFSNVKFLTYSKIQTSIVTTLLAIIFYISFIGLVPNKNSIIVRKTMDIIGAPFLIAALLLLNLTYLKIQ